MRVTLLGTGTSAGVPSLTCECRVCTSDDPRDTRLRCSALIELADGVKLLIDASLDCRQQLLRVGLKRLDGLLLTHPHADHVLGLDDLRLFNFRQQADLPVWGNAPTLEQLRRTFWYVFEKTQYEEGKPKLDLRRIEAGPFTAAGKPVEALAIRHGTLDILGFRLGSFAYVTDALVVPDETIERLQGLDVLVINALREKPHPTHQTLSDAVRVIEQVRPKQAWLTHVGHWLSAADIDEKTPDSVASAWDGQVFDLPEPA
jgi:phosphoribosyl 1,2-cyclic phosphate phosphodiesterase